LEEEVRELQVTSNEQLESEKRRVKDLSQKMEREKREEIEQLTLRLTYFNC